MPKRPGFSVIAWLSAVMLAFAIFAARAQAPVTPATASLPPSSYTMDVTFSPAQRSLAGAERIVWVNDTGTVQSDLFLRLYPNASYYHGGALTVRGVTVDRTPVAVASSDDPTTVRVPLPAPVVPGGAATIALGFHASIPVDSAGSFGILRLDTRTGIWALADWYPIVAGYDAGEGWYLAPPTALGDPTFSDAATYDVRLTMPAGLAIAGTGAETGNPAPAGNGLVMHRLTTRPPARDFALAIGAPGRALTRTVDGTTLRLLMVGQPFGASPPAALVDQLAAFTLDVVAAAFQRYARWFGPYALPDLDITYLSLDQARGVSWSGLTWISAPHVLDDGALHDDERASLAFTIAHEIGHQWLAGIIGSNNNRYGFITEGLDNALTPAALAGLSLPVTPSDYWRDAIAGQYLPVLESGQDGVVDRPIAPNAGDSSRVALIYGKAPLGFAAICERVGPEVYFAGLHLYGQRFRFDVSTPADLLHAFEDVARANGEDPDAVAALWKHWFEQANATVAEADVVLRVAGNCVPVG